MMRGILCRVVAGVCTVAVAAGTMLFVPAAGAAAPARPHVFVIVMENQAAAGAYALPYVSLLAKQYGAAYNYSAAAHPSLPTYLALTSGQTLSTCGDCAGSIRQYSKDNLFHQLQVAGVPWGAYAENAPKSWSTYTDSGTSDLLGQNTSGADCYQAKHFPAVYYSDIAGNPAARAHLHDLSALTAALDGPPPGVPNFVWITPNLCHDGHSCTAQQGDTWLSQYVPKILASAAFKDDGTLLITWDEAGSDKVTTPITMPVTYQAAPNTSGGNVAALVVHAGVKAGAQYDEVLSHYALLRAVETAFGLPLLGHAATAPVWTQLDAILSPPHAPAACTAAGPNDTLAAEVWGTSSATVAAGTGTLTVTGSGGTGSVEVGYLDDPTLGAGGDCYFASYGPSQRTHSAASYTAI